MPDIRPCSRPGTRFSRRVIGLGVGALATARLTSFGPAPTAAQNAGWRQIATETNPPARWDHTLAADDIGKRLVLFGGRDGSGAALADTWSFSRSRESWVLVDSQGPSPRFGHAVASDQERGHMYLFGGQAGSEFYNDLWQLDLVAGTWSRLDDGSGVAPSPRYGTSMVLTPGGELIVSHGFTSAGRFDDSWAFDAERGGWTDITPAVEGGRPLHRCLHEAIWAGDTGQMLLFGGCSSGFGPCPQGDLWSLSPSDRTWTDRTVADGPSARSNPALIYDSGRERALLMGGLTEAGYAADLWALALLGDAQPVWTPLAANGPAPRASHDAAITGPWLYCFGGYADAGVLNDLWVLDVRELETV